MPYNDVRAVHYDRPLETLSIDYHPRGLIGESVFKVVPVQHESDLYYKFNRGDRFRMIDTTRADGTPAREVDFAFTTDGYVAEARAISVKLTDREMRNQDQELQLQLSKVRGAQDLLLLDQERKIANLLADSTQFAAANQTNIGALAANQWNNSSYSGSIEQTLDVAKDAVRLQTGGAMANQLVLPKAVALVVKRDAKIRELIKYTHSDLLVDGDLPMKLWNMDVLIPQATQNTGIEGNTDNLSDLWGKHAWVLYTAEAPGLTTLSFGYIFRVGNMTVKTWRDETIDTTYFRPEYIQTEKVVSPYAGYLMQNVIA